VQQIIGVIEQHALLIVFLNVLLARGGVPIPVIPTLLTAAALAGPDHVQLVEIVLVAFGATLLADFVQYWSGRRYGQRFLGLLCRISFSPDFCVRRTQEVFARVGSWSLIVAKFLPGLSLVSVAMAGATGMPVLVFLLLDGIGGLLFVTAIITIGVVFQDAIESVLSRLMDFGKLGALIVLAALALYMLVRWWQRWLFIRQLRMDRITVDELRGLIDDGEEIAILDVRPRHVRLQDGIIPGALSAHPADFDPLIKGYPRELEIVIYCACPNEESAATAARHLKRAGFKKIRPLLGGIDAWIEAGHPVERFPVVEAAASPPPAARAGMA
jgi:membrane protein DedA with SNARE-associated domain/rhodanese-related sulfurtransferase